MTIEEFVQAQKAAYEQDGTCIKAPAEVVMELRRWTGRSILAIKRTLEEAPLSTYKSRVARALIQHGVLSALNDPIEYDPEMRDIFQQVDEKVERELEGVPRQLGFCHRVWYLKKQILQDEYGIEWFTPVEMNPHIHFD